MKIIKDIVQGSDQWLELRKNHFCASDAAAMMNCSTYKSRKQLLHEKKTGKVEEVSPAKQAIFDKGHAAEESARTIFEMDMLEDFPPAVCTEEIEGLLLLASLDGMADPATALLEHKLWNETLAANVSNEVLEPMYFWQLEHQLLVTGAECVYFVCSDGTADNWMQMEYSSVPERRDELIAGWKQFEKDLDEYQPEAKVEAVVGEEVESFPLITYQVEGSAIVSNIKEALPKIMARAKQEMERVLDTDQDFADKDKLNKATKEARAKLKDIVNNVQGEFVSFKEFADTALKVDEILQKMQSHGERQVKEAKEAKKRSIVDIVSKKLSDHISACNMKIKPLRIDGGIMNICPDFIGSMKNKRTIESLQNAVDGVLASMKIEIDQVMARVVPNQIYLQEHATEYAFLFADTQNIINQETEPFQAIVKSRIADHKDAEEKRLEAERVRIREEEEAKVKRDSERQAEEVRIKDEREKIDAERKRIKAAQVEVDDEEEEPVIESQPAPVEIKAVPKKESLIIANVPSFAEEMAWWAGEYNIPLAATQALSDIMKRHSIIPENMAS